MIGKFFALTQFFQVIVVIKILQIDPHVELCVILFFLTGNIIFCKINWKDLPTLSIVRGVLIPVPFFMIVDNRIYK